MLDTTCVVHFNGRRVWELPFEPLSGPLGTDALRGFVYRRDRVASVGEVLRSLQCDPALREVLTTALAEVSYDAYKWETPGVTSATLNQPFECVVLNAPRLRRGADANTFADYFASDTLVVEFASLGRDATLVVPCPRGPHEAYVHLAVFLRRASSEQCHALWGAVGAAMTRRVGERPVWLSTAGGGVAWLHVRLDDRPKYYGHAPYRRLPVAKSV